MKLEISHAKKIQIYSVVAMSERQHKAGAAIDGQEMNFFYGEAAEKNFQWHFDASRHNISIILLLSHAGIVWGSESRRRY